MTNEEKIRQSVESEARFYRLTVEDCARRVRGAHKSGTSIARVTTIIHQMLAEHRLVLEPGAGGKPPTLAISSGTSPWFLRHEGFVVLASLDPYGGFQYALIFDPADGRVKDPCWVTGYKDADELQDAAALHLCHMAWSENRGEEPPAILRPIQHGEFKSWARFQIRALKARRAGLSEAHIHDFAGRNPMYKFTGDDATDLDMFQRLEQPLFIGIYPAGIVYADRTRERDNDYVRLGFLSYATLTLELEPGCPADLEARIRADAATIQARKGELYQISTAGQTVLLGSALKG